VSALQVEGQIIGGRRPIIDRRLIGMRTFGGAGRRRGSPPRIVALDGLLGP
jgi:hypothetical protein